MWPRPHYNTHTTISRNPILCLGRAHSEVAAVAVSSACRVA